jgi:hypothetical protein
MIKSTGGLYAELPLNKPYETVKDAPKTAEKAENNVINGPAPDPISSRNEEKLSDKARKLLENLRDKYGDCEFLVGTGSDELSALSRRATKEFSVIFTDEEIERMAADENYAKEKISAMENAIDMSRKISEQNGFISAFESLKPGDTIIDKIDTVVDDNGMTRYLAELSKVTEAQKERIEEARAEKAEEKAAEKRTVVEATSWEELLEKIKEIDWENIPSTRGLSVDLKG